MADARRSVSRKYGFRQSSYINFKVEGGYFFCLFFLDVEARLIANLIECMAMFYFIKGLSVFRIVTEPCADCFLLFDGFTVRLHHALDVGGFGEG